MPPDAHARALPEQLGVLLISGGHERAQYAFMMAVAAAAMGRAVTLFATNAGCRALAADWSGIETRAQDDRARDDRASGDRARDEAMRAAGVAGLDELREAAAELGVRLMACDSGLRMAGMATAALLPGVEVGGIPSFLSAVGAGQIVTL